MRKRLIFGVFLIGFTAMISQIVLMRELMIVFYGNELSLGITLAGWLFWGAIGSLVIGPILGSRTRKAITTFTCGEMILGLFLPLSVIGTRLIPSFLGVGVGEIIGAVPMLFSSFLVITPITFLGGALFVLGCRIYARQAEEGAVPIGRVYILESIGAATGGVMASFLLIRLFPSVYIMSGLSLLNFCAAYFLLRRRNNLMMAVNGLLAGATLFSLLTGMVGRANEFSLNRQWRTYRLLASQNSIYQNLVFAEREGLVTLFTGGLYAFTVPDTATAERNAHIPLLEHPSPRRVLLIEGGTSGILREILKHPVERVDYVELDPLIIELSRRFIKNPSLDDPRIRIENVDARLWVKRTQEKYDVVILNLAGPRTAQINRFYTLEFFQELSEILEPQGIVSFSIYGNPNYISEELRDLYLTLKETLGRVFKDVLVTPGETNFFLACKTAGVLTSDWRLLMERINERGIEAKYVREYYLFADFSPERFLSIRQRLASGEKSELNRDFRPVSYYYDVILWSTYFRYDIKQLLKMVTPGRIWWVLLIFCIIIAGAGAVRRLWSRLPSFGVLTSIATTGFAEILFQVVTLLSFQIIYGYVYYKLSLILTSYMIGLILGSQLVTRAIARNKGTLSTFIRTQISIVLYPLVLPVLFWMFAASSSKVAVYLGSNIILPFLPIIPGLIGGFQFPLANRLYLESRRGIARAAGLTYGLDLFGACVGAIVVSVFLVPILGIFGTCLVATCLNVVALILIAIGFRMRV